MSLKQNIIFRFDKNFTFSCFSANFSSFSPLENSISFYEITHKYMIGLQANIYFLQNTLLFCNGAAPCWPKQQMQVSEKNPENTPITEHTQNIDKNTVKMNTNTTQI